MTRCSEDKRTSLVYCFWRLKLICCSIIFKNSPINSLSNYCILSVVLIKRCHCAPTIELNAYSLYESFGNCFGQNMSLFKTILAYVHFFAFIGYGVSMKHAVFKRKTGKYLRDSVITTKYAESELVCSMHCTSIDACLSVNYKASGVDQGLCQLNNSTTSESLGLVSDDKFVHLSILKKVRYLVYDITNGGQL